MLLEDSRQATYAATPAFHYSSPNCIHCTPAGSCRNGQWSNIVTDGCRTPPDLEPTTQSWYTTFTQKTSEASTPFKKSLPARMEPIQPAAAVAMQLTINDGTPRHRPLKTVLAKDFVATAVHFTDTKRRALSWPDKHTADIHYPHTSVNTTSTQSNRLLKFFALHLITLSVLNAVFLATS